MEREIERKVKNEWEDENRIDCCGSYDFITGIVLDANTDSIIFVNNYTINEYLGEPERYKILGHGKEEK